MADASTPPTTKVTSAANGSTAAAAAAAPTSIWSRDYWTDIGDRQRLQRLEQCRMLNTILASCEATHQATDKPRKKKKSDTAGSVAQTEPHLDDIGPGLRMLVYYNWRNRVGIHQKGCVPERHSVWTCRAVSLGCGGALQRMKDCFDAEGMERIMAEPRTAYQDASSPSKTAGEVAVAATVNSQDDATRRKQIIPCWEFQQAVGECVIKEGRRLAEVKIRWDEEKKASS